MTAPTADCPVVVKVGGSLLDWPDLPGRLLAFLAGRAGERLVLVAGGGRTVDVVRDLDRRHALGEETAHRLALRALDLSAFLLAALVPDLDVVELPAALPSVWRHGRTPVLAPRPFLELDDLLPDPLPHSWDVTSDSIVARLAARLGAAELALLKSAPLPPGTDREGAARLGLVDPAFTRCARALSRVTYVNLRGPAAPAAILGGPAA